jgi:pilus assembly protein Flp/PilA
MMGWLQQVLEWMRTRDDRGATAVEYGMIVALIAAVIIVAVTDVGTQVNDAFNSLVGKF